MNIQDVVSSLGKPHTDITVARLLKSGGFNGKLTVPHGETSTYAVFKDRGIAFLFEDAEYLEQANESLPEGTLILTTAFLYSGLTVEYSKYLGTLPFGLTFEDSRSSANQKLCVPEEWSETFHSSSWVKDGLSLFADFDDEAAKILLIQLAKAEPTLSLMTRETNF